MAEPTCDDGAVPVRSIGKAAGGAAPASVCPHSQSAADHRTSLRDAVGDGARTCRSLAIIG
jgi:hypothetical protein